MMTLAPEFSGSNVIINELRKNGIIASIGHSEATYDEALHAIEQGATHITHLFNAMNPLTSREPGIIGAGLFIDECYVELIADGHHVHKKNISALMKLHPHNRICLVTDAIKAMNTDMTSFETSSGKTIRIHDGRTWGSNDSLVGSVLSLNEAVKNVFEWTNISLNAAIAMATQNPAEHLGIFPNKGIIQEGSDADMAILNKDFSIIHTIVAGEMVN